MTTTKKKTTTSTAVEQSPKMEEAQALAAALLTQEAHASAVALAAGRRQALAAATEALEVLNDRLDEGDDSVTSQDVALASAEIDRATRLLSAAEAQAEQARRARINTSKDLAEALAPVVSDLLLGLPVACAFARPTSVPSALPTALLVQSVEAEANVKTGTVKGAVDLLLYRSPMHRALNAAEVKRALAVAGIEARAELRSTTDHGDTYADAVHVAVLSGAAAAVPVLAGAPTVGALQRLGWQVADTIGQGTRRYTPLGSDSLPTTFGAHSTYSYPVKVSTGTPAVIGDSTGSDGSRSITVEVLAEARIDKGSSFPDLLAQVTEAMRAQVGAFALGLGRVAAVDVEGSESLPREDRDDDRRHGIAVRARFVLASRLPDGQAKPTPAPVAVPVQRPERLMASDPRSPMPASAQHRDPRDRDPIDGHPGVK